MIIGRSRIGIGRIGIASGGGNEIFALANMSIMERRTAIAYANMNIVEVFTPYVLANMDIDAYHRREILANMSIIAAMDLSVFSNLSICDLTALSTPANMNIVETRLLSTLAGISILAPIDIYARANMSISGETAKQLSANMSIADLIELLTSTNMSICEHQTPEILVNVNIADIHACVAQANMDILDLRYWALGPEGDVIDLSGRVYMPQAQGFGLKTSRQRLQSTRRINLLDDGMEGGERRFTVGFTSDSDRQAFQEDINNDSENLILHVGRSDRYHRVRKVSVEPGQDDLYKGIATLDISCLLEDPYLYHAIDQGVNLGACPLPQAGVSKYNYGNMDSPILFKIGGFYSGGLQLSNPTVSDGTRTLSLGAGLLSREYAELTLDGALKFYLTHTYEDDFETNNYWQYDVVQSGCSLAGSQVSVPSGCWFYYKFQGLPLKENIRLTAKITKTGSPIIQYSTDGATWYTAVAASEITSGVLKEYWLTGTEKLSTVYIRFYSPSGSSMLIQDIMQFQLLRDISGQHDQIPMIEAGETGSMTVTGSGSTKARVQAIFRARWHPT